MTLPQQLLPWCSALVLAKTELKFFIVACVGLCFGFVMTQGSFSCCWAVLTQHQGPLFLTQPCQWVGWGCTRSWEGTHLEQLSLTDQRGVPYHMTSCSPIKLRVRDVGEGWPGLLLHGDWLGIGQLVVSNCFLLCYLFFFWDIFFPLLFFSPFTLKKLLNWLYLNPWVFALLPFWFSPPFRWVGGWASSWLPAEAYQYQNHLSIYFFKHIEKD